MEYRAKVWLDLMNIFSVLTDLSVVSEEDFWNTLEVIEKRLKQPESFYYLPIGGKGSN